MPTGDIYNNINTYAQNENDPPEARTPLLPIDIIIYFTVLYSTPNFSSLPFTRRETAGMRASMDTLYLGTLLYLLVPVNSNVLIPL